MKRLFALAPLAALAACTVGPDYHGPESASSPVPPAAFVRGEGVGLPNQPQAAQWWTTLGDPLLDELEQRALAASPTIEIAQARIKQARASLREERANALPTNFGAASTSNPSCNGSRCQAPTKPAKWARATTC